MSVAGIIAEFNPLHNGHKYLIDCAKADQNDAVVCVISGNFVQRGDVALISKWHRAESALCCGADIVAELPVPWSMSTAQNFALGGVTQLSALGVDRLYFGSECGDTELLCKVSEILLSSSFQERLHSLSSSGETFARIRSNLLSDILPEAKDVLTSPNDTLAVEYICAAKKLGLSIRYKAIKRVGAGHDTALTVNNTASSSLIRDLVYRGNVSEVKSLMPAESYEILVNSPVANIQKLDTAIITSLKMTDSKSLSQIPDISEGLDRLIEKKLSSAVTFDELCDAVKSKRYTHARIRRIILSAFLGIDNSFFLKEPPYVRVLGFNSAASKLIACNRTKPIVTKVSQIRDLGDKANKLFDLEKRISDVYSLSLSDPKSFVSELSQKLIVK